MKRLIKFDIVHPRAWLVEQKRALPNLDALSLAEYRTWLIDLMSNYSDFYTHYLNEAGWDAEEYFLLDEDFERKVGQEIWGVAGEWWRRRGFQQARRLRRFNMTWSEYVVLHYVRRRRPDVLFVRSQPIRSAFWRHYFPDTLRVARLSARLPYNWHPNDWDLIYTDQPDFQTFFRLHGVPTLLNKQGFDARINQRLADHPPGSAGIVFIGGLGTQNFSQRTEFLEQLAAHRPDFRWWGYWWNAPDGRTLAEFPHLARSYQGPTSGLEMYQLYRDALAVVNDYVDTANGIGFNQRIFEVMGCGGTLLTRDAPNFARDFPSDVFFTYHDLNSCLTQLRYIHEHPEAVQQRRSAARTYVHRAFNYRDISRRFGEELDRRLAAPR